MVFRLQLNCSYLHHNVKGVLVGQEHKKQIEIIFCQSDAEEKVAVVSSQRRTFVRPPPPKIQSRASTVSQSKSVWSCRSAWMKGVVNSWVKGTDDRKNWSKEPTKDRNVEERRRGDHCWSLSVPKVPQSSISLRRILRSYRDAHFGSHSVLLCRHLTKLSGDAPLLTTYYSSAMSTTSSPRQSIRNEHLFPAWPSDWRSTHLQLRSRSSMFCICDSKKRTFVNSSLSFGPNMILVRMM